MLFAGETYYACGGINDLMKVDSDIEALQQFISERQKTYDAEWWHIYDSVAGELVRGSKEQAYGSNDLEKPCQYDIVKK